MPNLLFRPLTIDDYEAIKSFTFDAGCNNCTFAFTNMCSYQEVYNFEFAITSNILIFRIWTGEERKPLYTIPSANGDLKRVLELLEADARSYGCETLTLICISSEIKDLINSVASGQYSDCLDRDLFDYIYRRVDLATLSGRKLQSKRNHVNRFKKGYKYRYVELNADLIQECLNLYSKWRAGNQERVETEDYIEDRALIFALGHFDELSLQGGAIFVGDELVAFSIGTPITADTFCLHFEKANTEYNGAYAVINQELAKHLSDQYVYINREDDMGDLGLRRSKLSYNPTFMVEKYRITKSL